MRMLFDTETQTIYGKEIIYDFGLLVINDQDEIIEEKRFIVDETLENIEVEGPSEYIKDNMYKYTQEIRDTRQPWETVMDEVEEIVEKYDIKTALAYNARFDFGSIKDTNKKWDHETPIWDKVKPHDILADARSFYKNDEDYKKFCVDNGYLTAKGRPRMSADIVYRYIANDTDFIHDHTSIADCYMELEIVKVVSK